MALFGTEKIERNKVLHGTICFFLSPFFLELTYPSVYIHLYMWKSYGCY